MQGTLNGYGERTGNCNLTTIIPNLTLKMGIETIPRDRLERLTPVSHHVAELVNMALNPQAPYVGDSAFAHKAGLHVSAIAKRPDAYEHVPPGQEDQGDRETELLVARIDELTPEDRRHVAALVESLRTRPSRSRRTASTPPGRKQR